VGRRKVVARLSRIPDPPGTYRIEGDSELFDCAAMAKMSADELDRAVAAGRVPMKIDLD